MTPMLASLNGGGIFAICLVVILLFVVWNLRHHHRVDGRGPGGRP